MNEQQLIKSLQKPEKAALEELYLAYRNAFFSFAQKFCKNQEDIADVYQDTIIVIQDKALKGELDDLKCSLKTYLFGIGKYMLYAKMRKEKKVISHIPLKEEVYDFEETVQDFIEEAPNEMELQLQRAFASLGKKCKEVLSLFYYRGYSIDEIREHLNYDNKNVVKSQKSRCIKQLKDKIETRS